MSENKKDTLPKIDLILWCHSNPRTAAERIKGLVEENKRLSEKLKEKTLTSG